MLMLRFEKPNVRIEEYARDRFYGKFVIEPLERGYGITLGNSLRRILLSSLPGSAVTTIKIEGVQHEFSAISGVMEDVTTIILNLKKLILQIDSEDDFVEKELTIHVNGEGAVTAADIQHDEEVTIINPKLHIATLSKNGKLDMTMIARRGSGHQVPQRHQAILVEQVPEVPAARFVFVGGAKGRFGGIGLERRCKPFAEPLWVLGAGNLHARVEGELVDCLVNRHRYDLLPGKEVEALFFLIELLEPLSEVFGDLPRPFPIPNHACPARGPLDRLDLCKLVLQLTAGFSHVLVRLGMIEDQVIRRRAVVTRHQPGQQHTVLRCKRLEVVALSKNDHNELVRQGKGTKVHALGESHELVMGPL